MDHYILDNPGDVADGSDVEVVIAAARLDMVTQLTEGLKKAGLEPTVIDIKPFALLRSLKASLQGEKFNRTTIFDEKYTEEGEIGAILEIGASSSTVTLVRGERVVMNRNLGVAGDDFTSALQRAFGLDFDTAEEVKVSYGSAIMPSDTEASLSTGHPERTLFAGAGTRGAAPDPKRPHHRDSPQLGVFSGCSRGTRASVRCTSPGAARNCAA